MSRINTTCSGNNCVLNTAAVDQARAGKAILPSQARPVPLLGGDQLLEALNGKSFKTVHLGARDVMQAALAGGDGDAQAPGYEFTAQQVDTALHGYMRILRTNYQNGESD